MKSWILALTVLGSSIATQATTLEFPVVGTYFKDNEEVVLDLKEFNKELNAKGLQGLPEQLELDKNAKPFGRLLLKRLEAIHEAYEQHHYFAIEMGYFHDYPEICYRGSPADVPEIIKAMTGTFLHPDQEILAIRYRSETITYDRQFRAGAEKGLLERYEGGNDGTEAWLGYDKRKNDVLVMSNLGPQGDGLELYATVIKACR